MPKFLIVFVLLTFVVLSAPFHCTAQEKKGGEDLAAKTQNPVGAMYSLPFKFSFERLFKSIALLGWCGKPATMK